MKLSKIIAVADISYYWKLIKRLIEPAHSTITFRVKKNRKFMATSMARNFVP